MDHAGKPLRPQRGPAPRDETAAARRHAPGGH